ncbi:MAG: MtaA/CmuA family methyltransferase [Syntrophomonadaceae bacterium]|nr:MtaA/CmuA family methyltransferase [Syntrophomonadaceae bacterium]
MITPKHRLINALNGEAIDRSPCICPGGMMNMATTEVMLRVGSHWPEAHKKPRDMARLALGVCHFTGIENLGVPFCMTIEAEAMGAKVNLGSMTNEPRVTEYPLVKLEDWKLLTGINPGKGRAGIVGEAISYLAEGNSELPVIVNLTGPISLAGSLIEPMVFFKAMGKHPELVHEFLCFITDNLIVFGRSMLQAGAQIINIADPSGTGEILGPRRFAEFALPYINRILNELQGEYQASMVHICGRLQSIFTEVDQLATNAISIDSNTSISKLRSALHEKVMVGNISTYLLQNGQPDRVKEVGLNCLQKGVAVLSPACGISPATPLVNLQAMVSAVHDFDYRNREVSILG